MEKNYNKEQQYIRAKKRVDDIKGFYIHAAVYVIINLFLSGIIIYGLSYDEELGFTGVITHFGVYSVWLFWGIGLFFHWLGVFGFKGLFGNGWEEKKIKQLMDKEEKRDSEILKK